MFLLKDKSFGWRFITFGLQAYCSSLQMVLPSRIGSSLMRGFPGGIAGVLPI